ncbi:MAG: phenylpyruvate tautomerase MIF-related protein [Gammaproteobacteria bacterium]|nr:phenylpyruvate tautomerase MIF-related protein [Gammaproteobacteria bacterium]
MPYLKIQTNLPVDSADQQALMEKASALVATQLGKPENYVMVAIEAGQNMLFAGTTSPLAYLELKSIGLPASATGDLSNQLCSLLAQQLGIEKNRIYIEFADAAPQMWGWDGSTF